MHTLIIGSTAMAEYFENFRTPKDLDLWTKDPAFTDVTGVDAFWHDGLNEFFNNRPRVPVATLDELYTIKCSHAGWEFRNGSWDKHMSDLVMLKNAGAKLQKDQFDRLYKIWQDVHGKKILSLNQDKGDFFTDAVVRIYDHDSIHASVAYGDEPMYIQTLKPGSTVNVDMAYIKAMSFEDQIKLYREEIYATALERLVIPNNYRYSPRRAYAWATRRTITGLTKGWSSLFLIQNYDIFRDPDCDYVQRHKDNSDRLIPLEEK